MLHACTFTDHEYFLQRNELVGGVLCMGFEHLTILPATNLLTFDVGPEDMQTIQHQISVIFRQRPRVRVKTRRLLELWP